MKNILGTAILLSTIAISPNSFAQDYSPLHRLGTNEAICIGGIETAAELQAVFVNDTQTIEEILSNAAWEGNKADLDAVIAAGDFVEKSYEPGSRFHWMAAKRKNTGVALPLREWAGKEAFLGYEIKVTSQCQVHTMVIPKQCCNLALMTMEPEPVAEPLVIVSTGTESANICTEQGNEMVVVSEDGTRVDSPLDGNGCWSGQLPGGNYIVKTTNPHCAGATSTETFTVAVAPAEVVEPLAITPAAKSIIPYFGGFVGYEARERYNVTGIDANDSANAAGVKFGVLGKINDNYSWFTQLGAYKLFSLNDVSDWSENNLFLDLGVERKLEEHGFVGIGLGAWNVDNKDSPYDDASYLIYGGGDIGQTDTQWLVETRFFDDDTDKRSDAYMVSLGLRHLFR